MSNKEKNVGMPTHIRILSLRSKFIEKLNNKSHIFSIF